MLLGLACVQHFSGLKTFSEEAMKQSIPQFLPRYLKVFIASSLFVGALFTITFVVSSANATKSDSRHFEVLRTSDQAITPATGLTLTVNTLGDAADSSVGDGHCDTDPGTAGDQCTLRAAIQEANAVFGDDTISFSVTGTINLTGALPDIISNVTINGPGSAVLTVQRSTAGGTPNFRIFTITGGPTVTISGATVTNGKTADGVAGGGFAPGYGGQGGNGGGILNSGTLTLTDVFVTGNRTGDGGAGTSGSGGFGGFGGGIYSSGPMIMTNVTVSNNIAGNGAIGFYGGDGGRGGGIYFLGSMLTMTNCFVTGNSAGNGVSGTSGGLAAGGGDAGGINAEKGPLILTNVVISGNHAGDAAQANNGGSGGNGGGILTYPGVPTTMTNCTVSNNNSGQGGTGFASQGGLGGGIVNLAPMNMSGCTVSGNFTKGPSAGGGSKGGGIFNDNLLTMTNCTVSGNHTDLDSGRGGGIYNIGSTLSLTNCTITGNSAYSCCSFENGQGIHNGGTANVRNTVIAGNGTGSVPDITGDFTSQGHNLIGKATIGSNHGSNGDEAGFVNGNNGDQVGTLASPLDALLGPLANNGGFTLTHALLPESPALDAGDNCVTQAAHCGDSNIPQLTNDQRGAGFSRIADGPDADTTATVDIGAYEKQAVFPNLANASTNEDTQLIVAFDVDDSASITSVTATSSNTTLVPNNPANISVTNAGSTEILTINPAPNLSGMSDITVTVNRIGGSTVATFTLTVNPVNDPPSFTKGPDQSVNENDPAQTVNNWAANISPGPPDESGQTVSFQVISNSNTALFAVAPAISPTGTLTYTPAVHASGTAAITVALMDNGGTANGGNDTSATQTFNINVLEGGSLQFNSFFYSVSESGGTALITVNRTGGTAGVARVDYATGDGSAVAGQDYTATSGTLTFEIGVSIQTFSVPITNDAVDEINETSNLTLTNGADTGILGSPATASLSIVDDDPSPTLSINDVQVVEGNSGPTNAVFTVTLSGSTALPVTVSFATANNTATLTDYQPTGGQLTFNPGETTKTIAVAIVGDTINEPNETFFVNLNFATNATISRFRGVGTILNDDTPTIQFSFASYTVSEGSPRVDISLTRTGDLANAASVSFATNDATGLQNCDVINHIASPRCDYINTLGTIQFAAGEGGSKSFSVAIVDDSYAEGDETFTISLTGASGAIRGAQSAATVTIIDNDGSNGPNPIDDTNFFVRQQYIDFLGREPDPPGFAAWVNEINTCSGDTTLCDRIHVSQLFFQSAEFQQRGYFVYRFYPVSFGRKPFYAEFVPDLASVSGFLSDAQLEAAKAQFAVDFTARPAFASAYNGLNNTQYVDTLLSTAGVSSTFSTATRQALIDGLNSSTLTRGQVLRQIVESTDVSNKYFNQAYAVMEYFGYLRREPDAAYLDWIHSLDTGTQPRTMVIGFVNSIEYGQRFGPP